MEGDSLGPKIRSKDTIGSKDRRIVPVFPWGAKLNSSGENRQAAYG
jgi:hypothetical protein